MNAKEYQAEYQYLYQELGLAMEAFYSYLEINNIAHKNSQVLQRLNESPAFWNTAFRSFHVLFLLTLRKLFDDDSRAHSIHRFINQCMANANIFSKRSLSARKRKGRRKQHWHDDYMKSAFVPSSHDMREFKTQLSIHRKVFDAVYRDIVNQIIAHGQLIRKKDVRSLYSKTNISNVDSVFYGLYDLLNNLWELYHNGRKPEFGKRKYDYRERTKESVEKLLKA